MDSEPDLEAAKTSIVSRTWLGNILANLWNWTDGWFSWTRQSDAKLRCAEKKILSSLKTAYKIFYVDIGSVVGQSDKIWTISLNEESPKIPLVMLHGLGAGLALWCPNLDAFAAKRPVYAIDLLGFGRSSRPKFASDPTKVEAQWVESLEEWRREMNLEKFILLGHSLGGYIATAYAIKYPERVHHLILADPWGFRARPSDEEIQEKFQPSLIGRVMFNMMQPLNPLWMVRAAGPAGRWFLSRARSDITRKYMKYIPDTETVIPEYIYQCNSQRPCGESAFHSLMDSFAWAKNPMVKRVHLLDPALPVTVHFGSKSWIDNSTGQILIEERPARTYVQIIKGASHHIYLDEPDLFNKYVNEACDKDDEHKPVLSRSQSNTEEASIESTATEATKAERNPSNPAS